MPLNHIAKEDYSLSIMAWSKKRTCSLGSTKSLAIDF